MITTQRRPHPSAVFLASVLLVLWAISPPPAAEAFSNVPTRRVFSPSTFRPEADPRSTVLGVARKQTPTIRDCNDGFDDCPPSDHRPIINRRDAILSTIATASAMTYLPVPSLAAVEDDDNNDGIESAVPAPALQSRTDGTSSTSTEKGGVTLYTTKSGLQYIELTVGSGPTPKYGQLCSIAYTGYVKLPDTVTKKKKKGIDNTKPQKFDEDSAFLIKHGNGRTLAGLDEGIHTMHVGGKRRIIIPPKLGYVTSGLGPLPEGPIGRFQLNRLLDQMVDVRGGNVIFDVTLRSAFDDEADQGYYNDSALSPDEFNELRVNVQKRAAESAMEQQQQQRLGGGTVEGAGEV